MSGHGNTGGLLTVFVVFGICPTQVTFFLLKEVARTIVNDKNALGGGGWDIGGWCIVVLYG